MFEGYVACLDGYGDCNDYDNCINYLKSLTNDPKIIKDIFDETYGENGWNWAYYDIETDSVVEIDKPPKTTKIEYHPCGGWNMAGELCQVAGTEHCPKTNLWFCWRHIVDSEEFKDSPQSDVRRKIEQIANSLLLFKAS